jgi:uncharacterized protein (DUF58 family)
MLTREVLRRVREIQIRTGRHVADVLAGQYVSVFRGQGIEFDEVRPYTPGDDVRTIDWNVTARMGQPFIKRFVEERQLTIQLVADVSTSMVFGSGERSKRDAMAELCALLAFSAIRNDDKVGLTLFHGQVEHHIPARKGQRHVLRVIREIVQHEGSEPTKTSRHTLRPPQQSTDVGAAMDFLLSIVKRRAVVFVLSDFLDDGYLKRMQTANRKHDVIAVHIVDPHEQTLPSAGLLHLTDAETGRTSIVDSGSKRVRDAFAETAKTRIEQTATTFRRAGIDYVLIDPTQSVVDPLLAFFKLRERRRRR